MYKKWIYGLQVASVVMIWLFVCTLAYWIIHLIDVALQLHDAPDASVAISIVAIPVYTTIAGVLTYVFVGFQHGHSGEKTQ